MTKRNIITLFFIFLGSITFGQESNQDTTIRENNQATTIGQVTFSYPLGTNGVKSYQKSNHFSFNMLVGLNGSVEGFEIGGLGNINNGNVNGAQFAGLANTTNGNVNGGQFSGLVNVVHGNVSGGQFSGLINANTGDLTGIQLAGILNFNKGDVEYVQVAGILNSNYGNTNGIQISGIANSNLNKPEKENSGLVQIAGIVNQNSSVLTGAQISGILNVATDSLKGAQISLINAGTSVKGVQIGLINICSKESEVIPIGLINAVKGGLFEIEFSANDIIYTNLNYKMGVDYLYSIFKIGYSFSGNQTIYTYGVGLGSYFNINDKSKISIEASTSNISDNYFTTTNVNLLNKVDLTYRRSLNDHFSFFAGPSLNTYVYQNNINESQILKPLYTLSEQTHYETNISHWVGITTGLSFRF